MNEASVIINKEDLEGCVGQLEQRIILLKGKIQTVTDKYVVDIEKANIKAKSISKEIDKLIDLKCVEEYNKWEISIRSHWVFWKKSYSHRKYHNYSDLESFKQMVRGEIVGGFKYVLNHAPYEFISLLRSEIYEKWSNEKYLILRLKSRLEDCVWDRVGYFQVFNWYSIFDISYMPGELDLKRLRCDLITIQSLLDTGKDQLVVEADFYNRIKEENQNG